MTPNQRRPGFRLPWSSEEEEVEARDGADAATAPEAPTGVPEGGSSSASAASTEAETAVASPEAAEPEKPEPATGTDDEPPQEFLRDLVAAMRRVADESKQAGLSDARARAEQRVRELEGEGERRRQELNARAETDIAAVGEWAKSEAERIKDEAERRVAARRTQLDEQLAADQARGEAEAKAIRDRIGGYERELDAYLAQLAEISDPAAFAAAAKRMPRPPVLEGDAAPSPAPEPARQAAPATASADPVAAAPSASTNGQQPAAANAHPTDVHPAEEEVLAARLAELDASLPAEPAPGPAAAAPATAPPDTTEVVVSGLGSFGAITSFRQALADVDGIQGVALSLGGSGEFVFRATHRAGFDMAAAIATLEGDAATVQPRPEGGLLVKLERRR